MGLLKVHPETTIRVCREMKMGLLKVHPETPIRVCREMKMGLLKVHPGTASTRTHTQGNPHPLPPAIKLKEHPACPLDPSLGAPRTSIVSETPLIALAPPKPSPRTRPGISPATFVCAGSKHMCTFSSDG